MYINSQFSGQFSQQLSVDGGAEPRRRLHDGAVADDALPRTLAHSRPGKPHEVPKSNQIGLQGTYKKPLPGCKNASGKLRL